MMLRFTVDGLGQWQRHSVRDEMLFDADRPRKVRIAVNAPGQTHVFAVQLPADDEPRLPILVASAAGLFEVEFSTDCPVRLQFQNDAGQEFIAVRNVAQDHLVERASDEVLTSIMTGRRNTSDFDRMVMIMRQNEMARERKLSDEIAKIRAAGAVGIDPVQPPVAGETAAPTPVEPASGQSAD